MLFFYLDFEGYQCCAAAATNNFIVKEISILSSNGQHCFTYLVKSPAASDRRQFLPDNATFKYQYRRHNIRWDNGDFTFAHAMSDIAAKVGAYAVYVKGPEKHRFFQKYLPYVIELGMLLPLIKKLSNCATECCQYYHGNYCARRKVHELKYYVDSQGIILN